jgi:hypothetical protein
VGLAGIIIVSAAVDIVISQPTLTPLPLAKLYHVLVFREGIVYIVSQITLTPLPLATLLHVVDL